MLRIKLKLLHFFQRLSRGWDDSEVWSLDITIARFTLPRLEALSSMVHGYPAELGSMENWKAELDKMILAFRLVQEEDYFIVTGKKSEEIEEGLGSFTKYYRHLWD